MGFAVDLHYGTTYDIAEPDMLVEIKTKTEQVDWRAIKKNLAIDANWVYLPIAKINKQYQHKPIVVLPFEVKDNKGTIIYPKGYKFNLLDYTPLNTRLIIIANTCHLQVIKPKVNATDIILIANNNPNDFMQKSGKRAFTLTEDAARRLGVKNIPAVITQQTNQFLISEFRPVRCNNGF